MVTGRARFTADLAADAAADGDAEDLPPEPPLHLKLLRSPHPHAWIRSIDASAALRLDGVVAVLSYADSPATLFSSARHHNPDDDPYDTLVLDRTVRFHGQRVAAVVAETVGAAEAACALISVDYEVRAAVTDPASALADGAPLLHPGLAPGNVCAEVHREAGDAAAGFAAADAVYTGTLPNPAGAARRARDAHHDRLADPDRSARPGQCGRRSRAGAGRLVLRTSTQVPFLTRDEIGRIFGLAKDQVRVVAKRVGGGFGGKQEMLTEDIVALAVLRTGRPVQLELTREEEFTAATTRHPMTVTVTLGATRDGTLTGLALDLMADTGAYGNHGPGVLFHAVEEAVTVYRCPNKRVDARAVYTNTVPAGAFRGYGLSQTVFAVESAIDELARSLGIDPVELRRRNLIGEGDDLVNGSGEAQDVSTASIGVLDCLDLAEKALASGRGPGRAGRVGDRDRDRGGDARHHPARRPPRPVPGGGAAGRRLRRVRWDGRIRERDHHRAPADRRPRARLRARRRSRLLLRHRPQRARHRRLRVDRDRGGRHGDDAGGPRPGRRDRGPRGQRRRPTTGSCSRPRATATGGPGRCRSPCRGSGSRSAPPPARSGCCNRSRRSTRAPCSTRSSCAGRSRAGSAQALGAALFEEVRLDPEGRVTTRALREYHVPVLADVPPTEVLFAATFDPFGPYGAKPMSEAPFNPVAPALANAVRDATGVRLTALPLRRDRVYEQLNTQFTDTPRE